MRAPHFLSSAPVALSLLFFWFCAASSARADHGRERPNLILTWDNDAINNNDEHYSQGARMLYLSGDHGLPRQLEDGIRRVPSSGMTVEAIKYGLGAGQEIYTPKNLHTTSPVLNDRPYAGWLYGTFLIQRRGLGWVDLPMLEDWQLDLGVVGPASLAEETQQTYHELIGNRAPQGWHNQLRNEPGFALRYTRQCLLAFPLGESDLRFDLVPYLGGNAGNISTAAKAGCVVRFGYNIPDEFEVAPEKRTPPFGLFAFLGAEGRYVAYNEFLDGTAFRPSLSVDRKPYVGDLHAGLTLVVWRLELTVAETLRTREFYGQDEQDPFGTASVRIKF